MGTILKNPLDYDQLLKSIKILNGKGTHPHPTQSIKKLKSFLLEVASNQSHMVKQGKQKSTLVIGLDSISYKLAQKVFTPNILIPLSSTFPSTSVCCWVEVITGLSMETTKLPGPVFFAPEINRMYNSLSDTVEVNGEWVLDFPDKNKVAIGNWSTIFHDLSLTHETVAINGYFSLKKSRWSQALNEGAEKIYSTKANWDKIIFDPLKIIRSVIEDIEEALLKRDQKRPFFLWTLVNTDSYIHFNGYNQALYSALKLLDITCQDLAEKGHTVIICSDHGQVPNIADRELGRAWDSLHSSKLCRLPVGGAGRVRWSYPYSKAEDLLLEKTIKLLGSEAIVLHRDDLEKYNLLKHNSYLKNRIGEIVTIALGDKFPITDYMLDIVYEHGSILPEEMIVPLVIY